MNKRNGDWGDYGISGPGTIKIRNTVLELIRGYILDKCPNMINGVEVSSGFECLIIEVDSPLTKEQKKDIEQIIKANIPEWCKYEFWNEYDL